MRSKRKIEMKQDPSEKWKIGMICKNRKGREKRDPNGK